MRPIGLDEARSDRRKNRRPAWGFGVSGAKSKVDGAALVAEVDRLDRLGDQAGIVDFLKSVSYQNNDVLFSLYKLSTEGHFLSAYAIAKYLSGLDLNNPAVDLARAVGGILFGNAEDASAGGDRLLQHASFITPDRLKMFRDSIAAPVYVQLMSAEIVEGKPELEARLLEILKPVLPELGGAAQSIPMSPDADNPALGGKAKRNFNFVLFNHPMISWYQMDDIIRPMMAGLNELGHRVAVNGPWNTAFIQIFTESFVHDSIFVALDNAKKVDATLGLLLTEDPEELRTQDKHKNRWDRLLKTLPYFDFFWDYTRPSTWANYVPRERLAQVSVGSYNDTRPLITSQRQFQPTLDFIIYGRKTPYRETWVQALTRLNYTVEYSFTELPNSHDLPPPDFVAQSLLGSAAILLDIPRGQFVKLPSASRLAFALQNGLPIIADDRIVLDGTIYDGFIETASKVDLVSKRRYYLSREFRQRAEARAAEWRARYRMADFMAQALGVVPDPI
jgi:hypothetical protein